MAREITPEENKQIKIELNLINSNNEEINQEISDPNKIIENLGYDMKMQDDIICPIQPVESIKYDGDLNKGKESLQIACNNAV